MIINQEEIRPRIRQLNKLAQTCYHKIYEYFNSQKSVDIVEQGWESESFMGEDNFDGFMKGSLEKLEYFLTEINQQITRTFTTANGCKEQKGQYKFLRALWTGHKHRMERRSQVGERIDGINQIVSMIKLRVRNLSHQTNTKMLGQDYQNTLNIEEQPELLIDHPLIEKTHERLAMQSMQLEQLKQNFHLCLTSQSQLKNQNRQLIIQADKFKQKNKKYDKALLQLTKKNVKLQKTIFDFESITDSPLNKQNYLQIRNCENLLERKLSDMKFQRKNNRKSDAMTSSVHLNQQVAKQMDQKFKNMKNFKHLRQNSITSNISLNSSIVSTDSGKGMRFQRTKKLGSTYTNENDKLQNNLGGINNEFNQKR